MSFKRTLNELCRVFCNFRLQLEFPENTGASIVLYYGREPLASISILNLLRIVFPAPPGPTAGNAEPQEDRALEEPAEDNASGEFIYSMSVSLFSNCVHFPAVGLIASYLCLI